jgi:hypothetical protein
MTSVATPEVLTEQSAPAQAGQISLADVAKAHDVRFLLATFVDMTAANRAQSWFLSKRPTNSRPARWALPATPQG